MLAKNVLSGMRSVVKERACARSARYFSNNNEQSDTCSPISQRSARLADKLQIAITIEEEPRAPARFTMAARVVIAQIATLPPMAKAKETIR